MGLYTCVWYPWKLEEGIESPGAGVTGNFEPLDTSTREPNSGPLQEQHVLLTTEPSLAPPFIFLNT